MHIACTEKRAGPSILSPQDQWNTPTGVLFWETSLQSPAWFRGNSEKLSERMWESASLGATGPGAVAGTLVAACMVPCVQLWTPSKCPCPG